MASLDYDTPDTPDTPVAEYMEQVDDNRILVGARFVFKHEQTTNTDTTRTYYLIKYSPTPKIIERGSNQPSAWKNLFKYTHVNDDDFLIFERCTINNIYKEDDNIYVHYHNSERSSDFQEEVIYRVPTKMCLIYLRLTVRHMPNKWMQQKQGLHQT